MTGKWTVRILGAILLVFLLLTLFNLQKRLLEIQQQRGGVTTTTR